MRRERRPWTPRTRPVSRSFEASRAYRWETTTEPIGRRGGPGELPPPLAPDREREFWAHHEEAGPDGQDAHVTKASAARADLAFEVAGVVGGVGHGGLLV